MKNENIKIVWIFILVAFFVSSFVLFQKRKQIVGNNVSEQKIITDNTNEHIEDKNESGSLDQRKDVDTSEWQTYKNEKYGFEIKYPKQDWTIDEKSGEYGGEIDSFFVRKINANKTFFGIFPKGGFGHGLEEHRETVGVFKEKEAKLLWVGKYNIPKYVYISKDYPNTWTKENMIEISGLETDEKTLSMIYESFVFVGENSTTLNWETYRNEKNGVSLRIPPYSTYKSENDSLIFNLVDKSISERLKVDFSEQDPAWWNDSNREYPGHIEKIFNGIVNGYQVSYYETYPTIINSKEKISDDSIILIAIIKIDENKYVKIDFSGNEIQKMRMFLDGIINNIASF